MTQLTIQDFARRCHANSARWFPTNHLDQRSAVTHCTLGLVGEAGEVANKVKKLYGYVDQNIPNDLRAKIVEELVDTLIYDLVLLDVLGADIDAEIEAVVAKCVARWGAEAASLKPPKVHKYRDDDPTATTTACGLETLVVDDDGWASLLVVDADARKVTCGNCSKTTRIRYIEREHK